MENNNFTLSIPKRSVWALIITIILGVFMYFQAIYYILPGFQEIKAQESITFPESMRLIWVPLLSYIMIGGFILSSVSIFKKLKTFNEGGGC